MTKIITLIFLITTIFGQAQKKDSIPIYNKFTTTELQLGLTLPSNKGFPETGLQKSISLHFGNIQSVTGANGKCHIHFIFISMHC